MSLTDSEITHIHDLFAPLGDITSRKMMGGLSIYCDGVIFAILDQDATLYLKAKDGFAQEMAKAGAQQFESAKGRTMCYWTLPDNALDDPDEIAQWGRRALAAL